MATSQTGPSQMKCCGLSPLTNDTGTSWARATSLPAGPCLGNATLKARRKLQSQTQALGNWKTSTSNASRTPTPDTSSFTLSMSGSRSTLSKLTALNMSLPARKTTREASQVTLQAAAASRDRTTRRRSLMMVQSLITLGVPAKTMMSADPPTNCQAAMLAETMYQKARAKDALALQHLLLIADCTHRVIE